MNSDATLTRLSALAVQRFGEAAKDLNANADLFTTLNIDSLQALDLLTDLEDEFDIEVPDYELQGVNSLNGLVEIIERRQ
jgi:acyl carrier protein